ncbi:predicted protein, partial [Postia placenta Mad-698-R]
PPGPPVKPIVGSILQVSPQGAWYKFSEYQKVYGDLLFFRGLGSHVLVLNSMKAINDLLDKRSSVYSNRPTFTVVGELMGLGQSMPLLPYGEEWRAHRRLAHSALSPTAVRRYHGIQEDMAALLCMRLLREPEAFFSHVRLIAGNIILSVVYGLPVETSEDEYIAHAERTMQVIGKATVPGAYLCDLMPFLKHLPSWVPFQREASTGREMIERLVTKPFEHVKRAMVSGSAPPSVTQDLLSTNIDDMHDVEQRIKWTTGAMYGAEAQTYSTVLVFIMAMALHPEKQQRAQQEIDRVIGIERFPRISDRAHLPYVNAVIKETMRWHPVLPLTGIARMSAQDDLYDGYSIPEGTVVIPNIWGIANDCPRATEFDPERFLNEGAPVDPSSWAFGFGKRLCPGKFLGENSVFILITALLAIFDITPNSSEDLQPDFTLDLVSYPRPFKCRIQPRS